VTEVAPHEPAVGTNRRPRSRRTSPGPGVQLRGRGIGVVLVRGGRRPAVVRAGRFQSVFALRLGPDRAARTRIGAWQCPRPKSVLYYGRLVPGMAAVSDMKR